MGSFFIRVLNVKERLLFLYVCLILLNFENSLAQSSVFTATNSGAWTTTTNWSEVGTDVDNVPDADDDVVIPVGYTMTIGAATSINDLTVNGRLNWTAGTFALTVFSGGTITVGAAGMISKNGQAATEIILNDNNLPYLISNAGTIDMSGDLQVNVNDVVTISGAGTTSFDRFDVNNTNVTLTNNMTGTLTLLNTLNVDQDDFTINGSGITTISDGAGANTADINISEDNFTVGGTGSLIVEDDIAFVTNTNKELILTGTTTISITDQLRLTATTNGAAITIGAGTTLSMDDCDFGNFTATINNSGTLTFTNTTTDISNVQAGEVAINNLNGGLINIAGDCDDDMSLTCSAATNTVNYTAAASDVETVVGATYYNLTISGTANRTSTQSYTVTNVLSIISTATLTHDNNHTLRIGGTYSLNGVHTGGNGNSDVTMAGTTVTGGSIGTHGIFSGDGDFYCATNCTVTAGSYIDFDGGSDLTINSGITVTNNGNFYMISNGDDMIGAAASSVWLQGTSAYLSTESALLATGTLSAAATSNTVEYTGSNNKTIKSPSPSYYHLNISGSATKDMPASIDINGDLTISGSAKFDVANNAYDITLAGNWSNSSSDADPFVQRSAQVTIDGTGTQSITNASGETFYDLRIAQTNNTDIVYLTNNINIANGGTLDMTKGLINLNANNLSVGVTGVATLLRTAANNPICYGTGKFSRWLATGTAISSTGAPLYGLFPVGTPTQYRPFEINATAGNAPTTAGFISVNHTDATGVIGLNPSYVDGGRTYVRISDMKHVLTSTTIAGGTYTITGNYTSLAVGTATDIGLVAYLGAGTATSFGTYVPNSGSAPAPILSRTGVALADLSKTYVPATINTTATPLPIDLLSFTAQCAQDFVNLNWITASEKNNDYFEIERSENGIDFIKISSVPSLAPDGNSQNKIQYNAIDDKHLKGVSYYRLKQTDKDGSFTYSRIITVDFIQGKSIRFMVYPNPNNGEFTFALEGLENSHQVEISLKNQSGKEVYRSTFNTESTGSSKMKIVPDNILISGIYICTLSVEGIHYSAKVIVK